VRTTSGSMRVSGSKLEPFLTTACGDGAVSWFEQG
jgi:hypothetical protein